MEVLHEAEDPSARVLARLFQAFHCGCLALVANAISFHARVCELSLLGLQPAGGERSVRQQPEAEDCN